MKKIPNQENDLSYYREEKKKKLTNQMCPFDDMLKETNATF